MLSLNVYTEFDYLNTDFNENFLSRKLSKLEFIDKDIISNGSAQDEKALNIIVSGKVKVVRPGIKSGIITSYELGVGHVFGIEAVISGENAVPVIVSADGDVTIYRIHQDDITEQMQDINVVLGMFKHYIKTMNNVIVP